MRGRSLPLISISSLNLVSLQSPLRGRRHTNDTFAGTNAASLHQGPSNSLIFVFIVNSLCHKQYSESVASRPRQCETANLNRRKEIFCRAACRFCKGRPLKVDMYPRYCEYFAKAESTRHVFLNLLSE